MCVHTHMLLNALFGAAKCCAQKCSRLYSLAYTYSYVHTHYTIVDAYYAQLIHTHHRISYI